MMLSLETFQELVTETEKEISQEELTKTIGFIFQYTNEIEKIHNQMSEIKKNSLDVFKSNSIDKKIY